MGGPRRVPARGTGGEPENQDRAAAAASTSFSSDMDLQTGLSRALLLLLFLHLMPLGRSHPLGGPSPAPHSELSGAQEPPDHLPGTGGKSQEEQAAPEPPQQGRGSKAVGETRRAASAAGLGPRDVLRGPKRMRDLGCFGGRMDRIGSFTGLGCNVLKRP